MILAWMQTNKSLDQVHTIDDLAKLQWLGDKQMRTFRDRWRDYIHNMRYSAYDPHMLRDMLYARIKNSKILDADLRHYDRLNNDDQDKSHDYLMGIMDRYIARTRLDEAREDEDRYLNRLVGAPAPSGGQDATKPKGKGKGKAKGKGKGKGGKKENSNNDGKGKGKNKGKNGERSRSSSKGSGKGSGGGKGWDRSVSAGPRVDANGRVRLCFYDQHGGCKYGAACQDAHLSDATKGGGTNKGSWSRASSKGSGKGSGKKGGKSGKGKGKSGKSDFPKAMPNPPMPSVCKDYLTAQGCQNPGCNKLHVNSIESEGVDQKLTHWKKEAAKVKKANAKNGIWS